MIDYIVISGGWTKKNEENTERFFMYDDPLEGGCPNTDVHCI